MNVVVYDRTSGDEDSTGQDPRAQLALTVSLAERAGFDVLGSFGDPDVQGDVPWEARRGLRQARALAEGRGCAVYVREVSRLWRGEPAGGLSLFDELPNLLVHGEPVFNRAGGAWDRDSDGDHLMRFIALWQSWSEKRRLEVRTRQAMTEIKAGRRETRSGKPAHRPAVVIEPAHLEAARAIIRRGGAMAEAHREVLRLRGFYDAKDPRTAKARSVSKAKVGEALGLYVPSSVRKANASESGAGEAAEVSDAQGSVADGGRA